MATEIRRQGRQGFASMTPEKRREIASMGGKRAHELGRAYTWDSEAAQRAGRKGGSISRRRKLVESLEAQQRQERKQRQAKYGGDDGYSRASQ